MIVYVLDDYLVAPRFTPPHDAVDTLNSMEDAWKETGVYQRESGTSAEEHAPSAKELSKAIADL